MTPLQAIDKYVVYAKALEWGSGSASRSGQVFGDDGVHISQGFPESQLAKIPAPCCFISAKQYTSHKQNPQLGDFVIGATFFTARIQDPYGSDALRFMLEMVWAWIESISVKGAADGIVVNGYTISSPVPQIIDGAQPMLRCDVETKTRIGAYAAGDYT